MVLLRVAVPLKASMLGEAAQRNGVNMLYGVEQLASNPVAAAAVSALQHQQMNRGAKTNSALHRRHQVTIT